MREERIINHLSEEEMEHLGKYVRSVCEAVDDYDAQPPHRQANISLSVSMECLRALATTVLILTNTARAASQATVELYDELEMRDTVRDAPTVTVSDIINAHKKKDDGRC